MRYTDLFLLFNLLIHVNFLRGQCNNHVPFPADPVMASTFNDTVVVTDQQHAGQYFVVEALALEETYVFTSSNSGDYFTIRDVYDPSIVIAQGIPPVAWVVPATGPDLVAVHVNLLLPPCGSDMINRTTTVVCGTCPGLPPSVGISMPTPEAILDIAGEIRIGDVQSPPKAGMIRWNPGTEDFEGYDGAGWKSLTRSNGIWGQVPTQQSTESSLLTAADGAGADRFGAAVSISGTYAAVGARFDDVGANTDQGSAYVFKRIGSSWLQEAKLTASDGNADDYFGWSVSISADYAIIGAWGDDVGANTDQGSSYIFKRGGNTWNQEAKLTSSDGAPNDYFGMFVSIAGDYAIVGAPGDDVGANTDQGSLYVFKRNGTSWTQEAKLIASDGAASDNFGESVSISGNYIIVGSKADDIGANVNQGSAYIFKLTGASWMQEAKLTAVDGAAHDNFGWAVSISGDYAIVGARLDDVGANADQGSAYVFKRSGTSWAQEEKLTTSDGAAQDNFGVSVSMVGDYAIIGSSGDDIGPYADQGSAYVFKRTGTLWAQEVKLTASDGAAADNFGESVSISGNDAIVGAGSNDIGANTNQGAVYLFARHH